MAAILDVTLNPKSAGVVNVKLLPAICALQLHGIKSKSKILFSYFAMKTGEGRLVPHIFIKEGRVSDDKRKLTKTYFMFVSILETEMR